MNRLLRSYLADPIDDYYGFYNGLGKPLVSPADLVSYCWKAYQRGSGLAEILLEEVPEMVDPLSPQSNRPAESRPHLQPMEEL
jgi:hypothetical protein